MAIIGMDSFIKLYKRNSDRVCILEEQDERGQVRRTTDERERSRSPTLVLRRQVV